MSSIVAGVDGEALPPGELVFKLVLPSSDASESPHAQAEMFALSPKDRETSGRLTVWAASLTEPVQAWAFLHNDPRYSHFATMNVDAIRSIKLPGGSADDSPLLEIVWDPLHGLEERPGANGHAGIVGLHERAGVSTAHRKYLRKELAKIAQLARFR